MEIFKGYKTYIAGAILIAVGVVNGINQFYTLPEGVLQASEWLFNIGAGLGFVGVKSAITTIKK